MQIFKEGTPALGPQQAHWDIKGTPEYTWISTVFPPKSSSSCRTTGDIPHCIAPLSGALNFLLSPMLPTTASASRINRYRLRFPFSSWRHSREWEHEFSSQSVSHRHVLEDTFFSLKNLDIFICTGILPASMYVLPTCAVPEEAGTGVSDRCELPCGDTWALGTAPRSSQPSLQPRERHISTAYHGCLSRTGEAGSVSKLEGKLTIFPFPYFILWKQATKATVKADGASTGKQLCASAHLSWGDFADRQ